MDTRAWLWVGCLGVCVRLLAACGPGDLPGFANPPPDDAGAHADASDEEDAGSTDGGMR